LIVAIESIYTNNVITPRGVMLLSDIQNIVKTDPEWPKFCLTQSATNLTCADNPTENG